MKGNILLLAIAAIFFLTGCNNPKDETKDSGTSPLEKGVITGSYVQKLDMVVRENQACSYPSQADTNHLRAFATKFLAEVAAGKYKIYSALTDVAGIDSSTPFSNKYNFEQIDTVMQINPVSLEEERKVVKTMNMTAERFVSLKIYNVIYTRADGGIYSKIKAIAPYYTDYDDKGNYRGDAIAFWALVD